MGPGGQQMRCMGMPEIVEAVGRQVGPTDQPDPVMGDPGRLHHSAVGVGAYEMLIGQPHTEL